MKENWFKLGMALFDAGNYSQALYAFRNATEFSDGVHQFSAYTWLSHLYDLRGERKKAFQAYEKALEINQDYTMTHSQYNTQINEG